MKSKLTGGPTTFLFNKRILNKYDIKYYICNQTGFIQTEEPFWLNEAYESVITKLDVGLVERNIRMTAFTSDLLLKHFDYRGVFLDYAGGYGLFTRMMRDKGFDFYNTDKYCPNLFAEYFDLDFLTETNSFELITAFEVLEHLVNPVEEIGRILKWSDAFLFTTELRTMEAHDAKDWHYISPETGQHIAFYNCYALEYLAKRFGCFLYSDDQFIHLFTKSELAGNPFAKPARDPFLLRKAKKYVWKVERRGKIELPSLIAHDWELIRRKISN